MDRIGKVIVMIFMLTSVATFISIPSPVYAIWGEDACDSANTDLCSQKDNVDMGGLVAPIVSVLLFASGIISVIMIIIGGMKFATSSGDSQKAASARKTVLYAAIGLVVSASAMAIVSFANDRLISSGGSEGESSSAKSTEEGGTP